MSESVALYTHHPPYDFHAAQERTYHFLHWKNLAGEDYPAVVFSSQRIWQNTLVIYRCYLYKTEFLRLKMPRIMLYLPALVLCCFVVLPFSVSYIYKQLYYVK